MTSEEPQNSRVNVDGIGAVVKHTPVISTEEDLLWSSEVVGTSSPLQLQRAIFHLVGKVFCLREAGRKIVLEQARASLTK